MDVFITMRIKILLLQVPRRNRDCFRKQITKKTNFYEQYKFSENCYYTLFSYPYIKSIIPPKEVN